MAGYLVSKYKVFEKLESIDINAANLIKAVNIEESQNTVLMDILECAKDSEYGRKYHFSDISFFTMSSK